MKETPISKQIQVNIAAIKESFGDSSDLIYRFFVIQGLDQTPACLVFIKPLVNLAVIDDLILKSLSQFEEKGKPNNGTNEVGKIAQSGIFTSSVDVTTQWKMIEQNLLAGKSVLFLEGATEALALSTSGGESRSVTEPSTEMEIRAPRDGFIESMLSNQGLIRKRIKDVRLRFEEMTIGSRTNTSVSLGYIQDLVDPKVLAELKHRLNKIQIDSVLESGYLEEFIEEEKYSIFPQIQNTERPDRAAAAILEGRIIVMVDNTPFVLIVPTVIWQFLQASGDYYERYLVGTLLKLLRMLAAILSLVLPSLYIIFSSYNHELLPTPVALSMATGRENVPFPAIVEVIIMEIIFEILREAGLRLPKPIGQAVSIVGALIIGQVAVQANLVEPLLVIIVATTGICSFAIPAFNLSIALRISRLLLLVATGILGVMGFIGGVTVIMIHLLSLHSFGIPYMSPLNPFHLNGLKDVFIRVPWPVKNKKKRG